MIMWWNCQSNNNYKASPNCRAILSLYYLYNATYKIDLNSIIYWSSPGLEPGSWRPKAPTIPLCYTPLSCLTQTLKSVLTKLVLSTCRNPIVRNHRAICIAFHVLLHQLTVCFRVWNSEICRKFFIVTHATFTGNTWSVNLKLEF